MEEERCRKRAREEADNTEILAAKKQECSYNVDDQIRRYEFHDGIGVFDFPWLKEEGVIFNSEPSFQDYHDQKLFAPSSYLHQDDAPQTVCSPQNPAAVAGNPDVDDEESLWSLAVDDLEQVDCIWSCVIDQPLDVGFNKG